METENAAPVYKRIVIKLSGEALREVGSRENISPQIVRELAARIKEIHSLGVQTSVVIGGGNIWRGLSASHHEVANGQLVGGQMVGNALVHILIVAAQQREGLAFGEPRGVRLIEPPPARGQQDDRTALGLEGVDRLEERVGLHDHARAAAVRVVVDGAMAVVRVVAEIDNLILYGAGDGGPGRDADRQRAGEELWKDGDDVDAEHERGA